MHRQSSKCANLLVLATALSLAACEPKRSTVSLAKVTSSDDGGVSGLTLADLTETLGNEMSHQAQAVGLDPSVGDVGAEPEAEETTVPPTEREGVSGDSVFSEPLSSQPSGSRFRLSDQNREKLERLGRDFGDLRKKQPRVLCNKSWLRGSAALLFSWSSIKMVELPHVFAAILGDEHSVGTPLRDRFNLKLRTLGVEVQGGLQTMCVLFIGVPWEKMMSDGAPKAVFNGWNAKFVPLVGGEMSVLRGSRVTLSDESNVDQEMLAVMVSLTAGGGLGISSARMTLEAQPDQE